jgi:hypothetical protein
MEKLKYCINRISFNSKARLLGFALLFVISISQGQGFSTITTSSLTSLYPNVLTTPHGYIATGTGYDSIDGNLIRPFIVQVYDQTGEVQISKMYYSEDWIITPMFDANINVSDSVWVIAGVKYSSISDEELCCLVWLNANGDTIKTRTYHSPFYQEAIPETNWIRTTTMALDSIDSSLYIVSQVVDFPPIQNNFMVRKIDQNGNILWTHINPLSLYYNTCNTIQCFDNKVWLTIVGEYNRLVSLNPANGNIIDDIELNGDSYTLYQANDFYIDNSGVVTACIKPNVDFDLLPAIYKMGFDGEYQWHTLPMITWLSHPIMALYAVR